MTIEVSPNDAATTVSFVMMLDLLAEIFHHIVGWGEMCPSVGACEEF